MDIFLIFYFFITIGILALVLYHYKRRHLYRAAAKFPGPRSVLPIIGSAHYFFGKTEGLLKKIITLTDTYGTPSGLWIGPKLFIMICKPDHIKTVLLSPKTLNKCDTFRFFYPWLGTGLFTAPAAKWRVHRKLIQPAFNQRILESFVDIILKQADIFVQKIGAEVGREEFEVFSYISLCTLDIICETAMGVSLKAQEDKNLYTVYAIKKAFEIPCLRIFKLWLQPDIIFYNTKLGKIQNKCIEYLHNQTNDIMQKKMQFNSSNDLKKNPTKWKPFLDLLMELSNEGKKITNRDLREEVDTMVAAGNETTATAMTFVIFMLAIFPEIQQKCYEELCEILGDQIDDESPIKNDYLPQMEYLERVIKETMRLFPVGPLYVRSVADDLDIGDFTLPKGCTAVISVISLNRAKDVWEDPLKFDPDRFLPEKNAQRHPFAYIPFSAGPRNCIGLNFAMMSMKLLLSTLICKYKFKKDNIVKIEDIEVTIGTTITTTTPVTVKVERRPKKF